MTTTNPPTYWLCRGRKGYWICEGEEACNPVAFKPPELVVEYWSHQEVEKVFPIAATLKPGECRRVRFEMSWEE